MRTYPERQEAFSVGQISKSLHRKFSEEFYSKGARSLTNLFVSREATLLTRPGTRYVDATRFGQFTTARLFTIKLPGATAAVAEVGDQYLRIKNNDGSAGAAKTLYGIAVSDTGGAYLTTNGDTWGSGSALGSAVYGIAANADRSFICAARAGNVTYSDSLGVNWTDQAVTGNWYAIVHTGTNWVMVGGLGIWAYATTPGGPWTTGTVGGANLQSIAHNGAGVLIAVGNENLTEPKFTKSTDHGQTWAARATIPEVPANCGSLRVIHTGSAWFIVGRGGVDGKDYVIKSTDNGVNWTKVYEGTAATTVYPSAAVWTGREIVIVGQNRVLRCESALGTAAWEVINFEGMVVSATGISTAGGAVVVVGGNRWGRSLDGGRTWVTGDLTATNGRVFVWLDGSALVGLDAPWAVADLPKLRMTQVGDVCTFTRQGYAQRDLIRFGLSAADMNFVLTTTMPVAPTAKVTGLAFVGTPNETGDADHPIKEWEWVVTWQKKDGRESLPSAALKTSSGKITLYPDRPVSISWTGVVGADRYHVYRQRNGRAGYVGTKESTGATTETFYDDGSIPVISQDPPQWTNPFAVDAPAVSCIFQDRRVNANTPLHPARLWFSANRDWADFDESFVKNSDDAFYRTLASLSYEEIRGLVWLGRLIVFTDAAEWVIGGSGGTPVAFDSIEADPETSNGSAWIEPIVVNKRILYVQARGNEIRAMYMDSNGWGSVNLTELAGDLFANRTVVDWGFARRPYGVLWVVLDNGVLLSCTYSETGWAWARHLTGVSENDQFEAITIVPTGGEDVPWFIVKRTGESDGGLSTDRYIERMAPRAGITDARDYCGLDCASSAPGGTYDGAADTYTRTALYHLAGRSVIGYFNGLSYAADVDLSGTVVFTGVPSLPVRGWIGYAYDIDFESLDYAKAWLEQKTVVSVSVETSAEDLAIDPSHVLKVGLDLSHLNEIPFSQLQQGILPALTGTHMAPGGRVAVRLSAPVPLEIKGITREIAIGK